MAQVVYLVRDLLFTSKIRETCKVLGFDCASAPSSAALVTAARSAALVIVDLRAADALATLDALRADESAAKAPIVGFIDHERTDVMESARARGCVEVLAKGQFSNTLPRLLTDVARKGAIA